MKYAGSEDSRRRWQCKGRSTRRNSTFDNVIASGSECDFEQWQEAGAMAASSTDDIPTQLAALLGKRRVAQIRKTDENPPRISIIDVIATISGKDKNQAAEDLRRISAGHPEVKAICFDFSPDATRRVEEAAKSRPRRGGAVCSVQRSAR